MLLGYQDMIMKVNPLNPEYEIDPVRGPRIDPRLIFQRWTMRSFFPFLDVSSRHMADFPNGKSATTGETIRLGVSFWGGVSWIANLRISNHGTCATATRASNFNKRGSTTLPSGLLLKHWRTLSRNQEIWWYRSFIYGIILPIDKYFSRWLKPPTRVYVLK